MKRIAYVWLAATILGGSLTVLARAQSEPLGDYARAVRKEKKQEQVQLLEREMDVMQREYRLRAAAFYADAGNRLRNAGSWDKEDAQYKQQLAEKQKSVNTAKEELQDMKERARKAGVPSSMIP